MNTKSPAYVLGFMVAVCVVFGAGISVVHYATQGLLQANEQLVRNRAICRAFMLDVKGSRAEDYASAVREHIETLEMADGEQMRKVYRRTDAGREALGFVISGMGFWDRITGILVMSPDLERVLNLQFLEHKETPGLGARIEEPSFTDQFKGLEVAWDRSADERVVIGASPDAGAKNRVDAVTGATQTSMALMKFLNEELEQIRQIRQISPIRPISPE
ncbi:MAG: FMN-binding protein [Kiritimatiellae bacterium]|nr:FMN-binding protein [Kiritimatiellia bacterium]